MTDENDMEEQQEISIKSGKIVLMLFMTIILSNCSMIDWQELNFTRSKPKIKNILGIRTPTQATLTYIRQEGEYPEVKHELEIRAGGTFSMRNMPDWWSDGFGKSKKGFKSGDGIWRLGKDENMWDIRLIDLEFSSMTHRVHLYGQRPPYLIFIRVGDPNEGNAMFFEQIKH